MGSQPRKISGSRAAAILGFSKFATPFSVWQEIMEEQQPGFNAEHGYILPKKADNASIRFGLAFESAIAELTERATGKRIIDREKVFERDFMTCHVDGIFEDGVLYEAKTTSSMIYRNEWGEENTDRIPRQYQVQIQHDLMLTGAQEAVVSVLVFPDTPDAMEALGIIVKEDERGFRLYKGIDYIDTRHVALLLGFIGKFHQYPVKANPEAQRLIVDVYSWFWHKHVLTGIPPEPRTYDDIKRLLPEPKKTYVVTARQERKLLEYKGITEEVAHAEKRKEGLKTSILKDIINATGTLDDESTEAVIFRNASGDKLGSWSRTKTGSLVFRC